MAHVKTVLGLCAGMAFCAAAAHAQSPAPSTEKFFLNVNLGGQLATRTINETATKTVYQETATLSSTQAIGRGVVFDFDLGHDVGVHSRSGVLQQAEDGHGLHDGPQTD